MDAMRRLERRMLHLVIINTVTMVGVLVGLVVGLVVILGSQ